jgi:hypothetical protein
VALRFEPLSLILTVICASILTSGKRHVYPYLAGRCREVMEGDIFANYLTTGAFCRPKVKFRRSLLPEVGIEISEKVHLPSTRRCTRTASPE